MGAARSGPWLRVCLPPSMDHRIYAIDAQTGKAKWQTNVGGSMVGSPAYSSAGVLYIGTFNSEMLAVNADNGQILWQKPTDGWVWGGPVLKADKLYFGDLSGSFLRYGCLERFDSLEDQARWSHCSVSFARGGRNLLHNPGRIDLRH